MPRGLMCLVARQDRPAQVTPAGVTLQRRGPALVVWRLVPWKGRRALGRPISAGGHRGNREHSPQQDGPDRRRRRGSQGAFEPGGSRGFYRSSRSKRFSNDHAHDNLCRAARNSRADNLLLYQRAVDIGAPISMVVGTGLPHDWPLSGLPIYSQAPVVRTDIYRELGLVPDATTQLDTCCRLNPKSTAQSQRARTIRTDAAMRHSGSSE